MEQRTGGSGDSRGTVSGVGVTTTFSSTSTTVLAVTTRTARPNVDFAHIQKRVPSVRAERVERHTGHVGRGFVISRRFFRPVLIATLFPRRPAHEQGRHVVRVACKPAAGVSGY